MFTKRLCAALFAALLTGCATGPPATVRNSDLLRELFYPPAVPRGALGPDTAGARFDHATYADVLRQIVRTNGLVDYATAKRLEPELNAYLVALGGVRVDELSRHEQLALLINAYNACTLKMLVEHPGVRSPSDVPAAHGWTDPTWVVNRGAVSLENLEHRWIRDRFRDARVHFALVRGAVGSPALRREPYTGARLEEQLADQARRSLADTRFLDWDPAHATLRLSAIFDRYRSDFADDERELASALQAWMPGPLSETLKNKPVFAIEYIPFDWKLNGTW